MSWLEVLGERITVRAHGGEHEDRYAVVEELTPPGGGPPVHRHAHEDEIVYVAQGPLDFIHGDRTFTALDGEVVVLPRGIPHGFGNPGERDTRIIVTIVPGGFERFFERVAARGLTAPDDAETIAALAAEFGVTFE